MPVKQDHFDEFTLTATYNLDNCKKKSVKCYGQRDCHSDMTWTPYVMKEARILCIGLDCFKSPKMYQVFIEATCEVRIIADEKVIFLENHHFEYRNFGGKTESPNMWRTINYTTLNKKSRDKLFKVEMDLNITMFDVFWMTPKIGCLSRKVSSDGARTSPNSVAEDFKQQVLQALVKPAPALLPDTPSDAPSLQLPATQKRSPSLETLKSTSSSESPATPKGPEPYESYGYSKDIRESKCPMCKDVKVDVLIQCGHAFCFSCIRREPKCPTCIEQEANMEKTVHKSYRDMADQMGRIFG